MIRTALAACLAFPLSITPAAADLYALVIGVDQYDHLPDLRGAVNDANDIADAVSSLGATDLRILLNGAATREAIYANWEELAAKAGAGDTLLVTYAGHGGTEPADNPGEEDNDRDENIQLSGFRPVGEAAGQRIRDDEIAALIALETEAEVIFVADSCHSGSVYRQSTGLARYSPVEEIVDDPLPRLAPLNLPDHSSGEQGIFFGAVPESELVYEITEGVQSRGALSLAFAAGLRGAADRNKDGVLTKGELEFHVRRVVEARTDGSQFPVVEPAGIIKKPLFNLRAKAQPSVLTNPFGLTFDELPPVAVEIVNYDGDAETLYAALTGIQAARDPQERLRWDYASRTLISARGDTLARLDYDVATANASATVLLQKVINKMRVALHLRDAGLGGDLRIVFPTGTQIYRENQKITMALEDRQFEFPVIFNLASDGTIHFIYPDREYGDRRRRRVNDEISLDFWASPPFGADHLVVIETAELVRPLMRAVSNRHRDLTNVDLLWDDLHFALKDLDLAFAVFPYFTAGQN